MSLCHAACNRGFGRSRPGRSAASDSLAPAPTPRSKAFRRCKEQSPCRRHIEADDIDGFRREIGVDALAPRGRDLGSRHRGTSESLIGVEQPRALRYDAEIMKAQITRILLSIGCNADSRRRTARLCTIVDCKEGVRKCEDRTFRNSTPDSHRSAGAPAIEDQRMAARPTNRHRRSLLSLPPLFV